MAAPRSLSSFQCVQPSLACSLVTPMAAPRSLSSFQCVQPSLACSLVTPMAARSSEMETSLTCMERRWLRLKPRMDASPPRHRLYNSLHVGREQREGACFKPRMDASPPRHRLYNSLRGGHWALGNSRVLVHGRVTAPPPNVQQHGLEQRRVIQEEGPGWLSLPGRQGSSEWGSQARFVSIVIAHLIFPLMSRKRRASSLLLGISSSWASRAISPKALRSITCMHDGEGSRGETGGETGLAG